MTKLIKRATIEKIGLTPAAAAARRKDPPMRETLRLAGAPAAKALADWIDARMVELAEQDIVPGLGILQIGGSAEHTVCDGEQLTVVSCHLGDIRRGRAVTGVILGVDPFCFICECRNGTPYTEKECECHAEYECDPCGCTVVFEKTHISA